MAGRPSDALTGAHATRARTPEPRVERHARGSRTGRADTPQPMRRSGETTSYRQHVDISGYVVLGIVTLFLVYLMPQLIRSRQEVLDSRLADRFSADLRILATAGVAGGGSRPATADDAPHVPHDPRLLRTEVHAMDRPTARVTSAPTPPGSDDVRARTARRRRAAARRRLALTLALLGLSAWAWTAVTPGAAHVALAAAPTTLLVLVLVLGRRAAAGAARADGRAAVQRAARGEGAGRGMAAARPSASVSQTAPAETRVAASRPSTSPSARPATARRAPEAAPGLSRAQWGASSRDGGSAGEASTEIIPRLRLSRIAAARRGDEADAAGAAATGSDRAGQSDVVEAVGSARPGTDARAGGKVDDAEAVPEGATAEAEAERSAARRPSPANASSGSWTPVPVPVPTYTLKPPAPRTTPAPLVIDEAAASTAADVSAGGDISAGGDGPAQVNPVGEAGRSESGRLKSGRTESGRTGGPTAGAPAVDGTGEPVRSDDGSAPADETAKTAAPQGVAPTGSGLDLDAVLSRRRASGE